MAGIKICLVSLPSAVTTNVATTPPCPSTDHARRMSGKKQKSAIDVTLGVIRCEDHNCGGLTVPSPIGEAGPIILPLIP